MHPEVEHQLSAVFDLLDVDDNGYLTEEDIAELPEMATRPCDGSASTALATGGEFFSAREVARVQLI